MIAIISTPSWSSVNNSSSSYHFITGNYQQLIGFYTYI